MLFNVGLQGRPRALPRHAAILCLLPRVGPKLFPAVQLLKGRDHRLSQDSKLARIFENTVVTRKVSEFSRTIFTHSPLSPDLFPLGINFPPGAWRTDRASTSVVWVTPLSAALSPNPSPEPGPCSLALEGSGFRPRYTMSRYSRKRIDLLSEGLYKGL